MQKLEILVPNEWRKLKNLIMAVLKKGLCEDITVLNYAKSYTLQEKKLIKTEKKLISFHYSQWEEEKIITFIEQVSGRTRVRGDLVVQ